MTAWRRSRSTRTAASSGCAGATKVGSGPAPPPVVLGDVVIAAGGFGGGYAAISARTGKALWRFPTSAPALAPVIAAKGRIYAGDFGGTLRVFAPKPAIRGPNRPSGAVENDRDRAVIGDFDPHPGSENACLDRHAELARAVQKLS